jgi:hypothetical protein
MPDPIVQGIVDKLYPPSEDTGPVYVKVDEWKWCHRHNGPIGEFDACCVGWSDEDPGRCGRSPLYVEALDP